MAEVPLDIKGFRGLNLRESPGFIKDEELLRCDNLNTGRTGELVKRTGFSLLHDGGELEGNVVMLGHYRSGVTSQFLADAENGIFVSNDGGSWIEISSSVHANFGVQYAEKFYLICDDGIRSWNGTTLSGLITDSPKGTFGIVFKDRLFVCGDADNRSRLYFSEIGDFETWPSTNFIDIERGGDDLLVTAAVIQDILIIFKGRTTWSLNVQGSPTNWVLRIINTETGCISSRGVRELNNYLYFIGARAVWRTDGFEFDEISKNLDPIFSNRIINENTINLDSTARWENMFILLIHPESTSNIFRYLVYHIETSGWTEWKTARGIHPSSFLEVDTPSLSRRIFAGDLGGTGRVFRFGEDIFTDAGEPYLVEFETKHFDFAIPSVMKRGKWAGVEVLAHSDFNLRYILEGNVKPALVRSGSNKRNLHKMPGPGYFRTWGFRFSEQSSSPFFFFQLSLHIHRKPKVIKAVT